MTMETPLRIGITDAASLEAAAQALHDAPFDHKDIRYDPTAQTFEMVLRHTVSGRLVRTRFRWLYREVEKPKQRWVKCKLTFRQVEHADIRIESPRDGMLIDLEYDSATRTVTMDAPPDKIVLRVPQLDGELADIT
jgi:hypothetical protein